ncbi:MAG: phosphoribosylanthranilate isomerase [Alphaproteobacteria bacterium]|nr:phosphoribosylanthranilate isomerase [Alphaproteobacteria bacterium]
MTQVKICGIKEAQALEAAVSGGARFVGFVFYPRSPRFIEKDSARELALRIPAGVRSVGLFVDPDDALLEDVLGVVGVDMVQLHGAETPERVAVIKERFGLQVMKALPVSSADDIQIAAQYEGVADWLLFDAKAPEGAVPGGTGTSFDWGLLQGKSFGLPWMLSGGLTAENVGEALAALSPSAVDVSSGVEVSRGVKDPAKIRAFLAAVKAL